MTRTWRVGSAVFVSVLALGLTGSPVVAHASPFASFRSAAADQYQGNSGNGGGGNGNGNGTGNGNGAGNGHKHKSSSRHHASGLNGQSASGNGSVAGANVGVAPSTHPIRTRGTLPFTGLNLTVLVLIALGLLCGGLSLRAAERLNRRRRANPAS
jgi:hypothetical protein